MPARQPRNLPFASLGDLFKGRERALEELRAALAGAKGVAVAGRVLHGLGGIGKTRLAIEYAWAHEADYSALLFVRADDAATLNAGLAALAGAEVLDLPENEAREDAAKIAAVLRWLEANPTWLLILDNVDDREAVAAVANLMPRLKGGHVIVTARAANFPGILPHVRTRRARRGRRDAIPARAYGRRRARRRRTTRRRPGRWRANSAGSRSGSNRPAPISRPSASASRRYLKLWNENRDKVLGWSDATLTGSDKTLATTWATSVARLSPKAAACSTGSPCWRPTRSRMRCIDVAVPGETASYDAYEARKGLYAYSLATQAKGEDGEAKGLVVHRLVQDFARRAMSEERRAAALREALGWVNAAFTGDPQDVRTWPVLDPLAPHALAVARRVDEAGVAKPTALFNNLGLLFEGKARYAEAEPLYRRAVQINTAVRGESDPIVATCFNNLARLLQDTNRLAEAEPLFRRALKIDEASYGPDHPEVATILNNLASLLQETSRLAEAEPLYRRALKIDEASSGPDHPNVAIRLNNLAVAQTDEPSWRGRAAPSPRAQDQRGELWAGSSRGGERPKQSCGPAPSHEPPRRGRAALSPRAQDPREKLRAGSPRRGAEL